MTVASVRKVKWDSFQPNFFIVFAPGVLDETAGTYLTSAYFTRRRRAVAGAARAALSERVDLRYR